MSIKSQEGHMRQLALLLTTDLGCIFGERESGPNGSKKAFLNVGKVFLRALAKDLGLHEVNRVCQYQLILFASLNPTSSRKAYGSFAGTIPRV